MFNQLNLNMKKIAIILFAGPLFLFTACSNGQSKSGKGNTSLSALEFADKLKATPTGIVLDVRTPDEFEGGHLQNAINIDWNNSSFSTEVAKLNKATPVFVYCLSGGRSQSAAAQLRADGFKEVYEMQGGLMKWRAAGLSETTDAATPSVSQGMSVEQFQALVTSDKLVLVDFYAPWCAPCKKMKPYLDEITIDMADKVVVVRIDVDANKALVEALKIEEIPVLHIYKKGTLVWNHTGFIEKEAVVEQLK
jgi:thioredoxin